MLLFLAILAQVSASLPDATELVEEENGVCLLQNFAFMHKYNGRSNGPSDTGGGGGSLGDVPCPGVPVVENAHLDSCSFSGVDVHWGGTSIVDLFDDNVEIKNVHYFVNGGRHEWHHLETHPFPVGVSKVYAEGTDLAGNVRRCFRSVTIEDKQKPKWVTDSAAESMTMPLSSGEEEGTEGCVVTASSAFAKYEEMGWSATATDNCGVESVTRQVKKGGEVIYDDSAVGGALVHARGGTCRGTPVFKKRVTTGPAGCVALAAEHDVKWGALGADGFCRVYGGDCSRINSKGFDGTTVYSKNNEVLRGPGTYELVYKAVDVHGNHIMHTVELKTVDVTPPTEWKGCPDNIFVEIGEEQWKTRVNWEVPYVTKDNCMAFGTLPDPLEVDGRFSGHEFHVGDHEVAYPLFDAFGNVHPDECDFLIEIKQKAHKVVLTCPADQVISTVEYAGFGVGYWPAPTATQDGKALPEDHIMYLHGLFPGLPFPYGETVVTVWARGLITGDRTLEEEQDDECSFKVTVKDPFHPYVDGRRFRCDQQHDTFEDDHVEPYGVCDGTDLSVNFHEGYVETGGYSVTGTQTKRLLSCCNDEHGAEYVCGGTEGGRIFKYCAPTKNHFNDPLPDPINHNKIHFAEPLPDPIVPKIETVDPGECRNGLCGYQEMLVFAIKDLWTPSPVAGLQRCKEHCASVEECTTYSYCHESREACDFFPNMCYLFKSCDHFATKHDAAGITYTGFETCPMHEPPKLVTRPPVAEPPILDGPDVPTKLAPTPAKSPVDRMARMAPPPRNR